MILSAEKHTGLYPRIKRFFCFLFLFISISGWSQEGSPLLTHFKESTEIENQSWSICQDEDRVMLFANRKGILSFDGEEWLPLKIPIIPSVIRKNPFDGKIYVGANNNYGLIEKQSGSYRYINLSVDSTDIGMVSKIIFNDSIVWFYGEKTISRYNSKTNQTELRLISGKGSSFSGMFTTPENTYVISGNNGMEVFKDNSLNPLNINDPVSRKSVLFSLPYSNESVLIGFSDGKMSLFDGAKYYDFEIKDDGYIRNNILSDGLAIGDSLYVFSTLDGGAVVIEKDTRQVKFYINNQNGLPDDEIYAMSIDKSGGLWLSHQFGLTRADLNLPLGDFSVYPGLKGNLTISLRHNNELYVATSEGVFYLSRVKNYSMVETLTKNEIITRPEIKPVPHLSQEITVQLVKPAESPANKRKLLPKIFTKKSVPVNQQVFVRPVETEVPTISNTPLVKYSWRKVSKLKSVDYMYKKVEGLNEKCRQLVSTKQGILAATNRGLYSINNYKAELVAGNRYVNFISWQPFADKYSVAAGDGYFLTSFKNSKWTIEVPDIHFTEPVYSIIQTADNTIWMGGENIAYRADLGSSGVAYKRFRIDVDYPQRYLLNFINDTLFLFTETGISFFDNPTEGFLKYLLLPFVPEIKQISYPLANIPLMKFGDDWICMEDDNKVRERDIKIFRLFDEIVSVTNEKNYIWIIDRENRLFGINRKRSSNMIPETKLLIKNIRNERGTSFDFSNIVFTRGENEIHFKIVTPMYLKQNITQYQYFIGKNMSEWSEWSTETNYSRLIPKSGDYVLQIRARDLWGDIGEPVSISFTIKAPFTKTSMFYILVVIAALIVIFTIFRFRESQLQEKNRILEEKVKERTAEIEAQKGEITSSIQYASRIQFAMLPMNDLFNESFSDFFIIFKPRSIVSGDFYWIAEDENNIFLTVADCTGHGVPGAFMSALGISILNEIVTHNKNMQANKILNLLRERIKKSLHQTGKEGEAADGMDISLCIIKKNRKTIQFSGAYNHLFIVSGGEIMEYKGDRMPIGIHYGDEASFSNYEINIMQGDAIYLLSDGLTDQFGGPESTKFKKSNLRKLLADIQGNPMSDQKKKIELEFEKWKGKSEQVDDITFIGVQI